MSTLASLRALVPPRQLQFDEALRIAELQANHLLDLSGVVAAPVPTDVITQLPRIRVKVDTLRTSGESFWSGQEWVICLTADEPPTRQRFTLFHEYKHILDYGRKGLLYRGDCRYSAAEQAELAAEYFAGCVLMPKRLLKRAWGEGIQRPSALGRLFDTSPRAIEVRLMQLGLSQPRPRCQTQGRVGLGYRSKSQHVLLPRTEKGVTV
jgi:Zn-dependent peptidase ImmA (M78 family)